jgi:hypothetical protein
MRKEFTQEKLERLTQIPTESLEREFNYFLALSFRVKGKKESLYNLMSHPKIIKSD